jgi:O-antigen ligase
MAVFKTHWTLVLIFTAFAFEQLLESFFPFFARKSWVINVSTVGITSAALLISFILGKRPFKGIVNINTFLILSLYLFAAMGVVYTIAPEAGRYFLEEGSPYFVLLVLMLPALVSSTDQISKMTTPFMLIGLFILAMILISPRTVFYGTRMFIDLSYTRGSGERGNPLALGELGGTMMIISVLVEPERKNALITLLRISALLIGLSVSFFVGSRGQLVFSLFVAILFYPVAHQIRDIKQFFLRAASIGITLLLVAFVAVKFLSGSEAADRFSSDDIAVGINSRTYYMTEMLNAWGSNPAHYLQGLGTGAFNTIVPHGQDGFIYPHNVVIEVLTHHGLIGFTLLCFIFLVTGVHALRLINMGFQGLVNRGVVAIVLAMALYVTMISLKQGSFVLYPLPFYMYMLISKLYSRTVAELALAGEGAEWGDEENEYHEYGDYGDDESAPQTA